MKVAVIVISYNEEKYLSEAIESVLCQECDFDYEIIIGDDGSNDGSIDVIKKYAKKYPDKIKYFVMHKNSSLRRENIIPSIRVSNLIKKGLNLAAGEYVNILSGDDIFCDKYKLSDSVDLLSNKKNGVAVCAYNNLYSNGETENCVMRKLPFVYHWSYEYIHISCFLFRKNIVMNNLLERFCDDVGMIFTLGVYSEDDFVYTDKVMFSYRRRENSIMYNSDKVELSIIEILMLQDIMNDKKFNLIYTSRFFKPLSYLLKNRCELNKEKYKKYFNSARIYENDILFKIKEFNKISMCNKFQIIKFIAISYCSKLIMKRIAKMRYPIIKKYKNGHSCKK